MTKGHRRRLSAMTTTSRNERAAGAKCRRMIHFTPPLPAAVDCRGATRLLRRTRSQWTGASVCLFRAWARAALGRQVAHERRGPKDRCELCQVARATEVATSLALRTWQKNAKLPTSLRHSSITKPARRESSVKQHATPLSAAAQTTPRRISQEKLAPNVILIREASSGLC